MGLLIDGQWKDDSQAPASLRHQPTGFHHQITADGSSGFKAEAGRYHLYIAWSCPWAQRTMIARSLKKLDGVIDVSIVQPVKHELGWELDEGADKVNGKRRLYEVYQLAQGDYTGRVSVPVLWDKKTRTIVNNESAEILRILNSAFNAFGDASVDLYPEALRAQIDELNAWIAPTINSGVYKAGHATRQEVFDQAVETLFASLDRVEATLGQQRYLTGNRLTEADWRLFTTLLRFDTVYFPHFKCNVRRVADYPNLWNYTRELYQVPGIAGTVDFTHVKRHYYLSYPRLNPTGLIPKGPALDLLAPHDRGRFRAARR